MTRHYCDRCDAEMTAENSPPEGQVRFAAKLNWQAMHAGVFTYQNLTVELLPKLNGDSQAGEFCKYCLIDVVKTLDDRPLPDPEPPPADPEIPRLEQRVNELEAVCDSLRDWQLAVLSCVHPDSPSKLPLTVSELRGMTIHVRDD
jgi:hypothetical protein